MVLGLGRGWLGEKLCVYGFFFKVWSSKVVVWRDLGVLWKIIKVLSVVFGKV